MVCMVEVVVMMCGVYGGVNVHGMYSGMMVVMMYGVYDGVWCV